MSLEFLFHVAPVGAVEAGAVVPGLADVPGGAVVPVDGGTVPGEVGPVMPVVTGGSGVVTVQRTT